MPRYQLTIEYDGTGLVGWQSQANGPSVQGALMKAIQALTGETVTVFGAGRTDAGVHALAQVAHIDLCKAWLPARLMGGLNYHVRPYAIAVINCVPVQADFDARFSAQMRHYRYLIINRQSPLTLSRMRAWHVRRDLDHRAMQASANILCGTHDFTSFRASACQAKSPIRTLDRLAISRSADIISIEASAKSFLHHQIRSIVGCLHEVGSGRWDKARLQAVLVARDRQSCAALAPACGLYFVGVDYNSDQSALKTAQANGV